MSADRRRESEWPREGDDDAIFSSELKKNGSNFNSVLYFRDVNRFRMASGLIFVEHSWPLKPAKTRDGYQIARRICHKFIPFSFRELSKLARSDPNKN